MARPSSEKSSARSSVKSTRASYSYIPVPYNKVPTPTNLTASKYSMSDISRYAPTRSSYNSNSSTAVLPPSSKQVHKGGLYSTPRAFPPGQEEEADVGILLPPSRGYVPFRSPGDGMVDVPLDDLNTNGTTMYDTPLGSVAIKERNIFQRIVGDWFQGRADEVCCVAYIVIFKLVLFFVIGAIFFVIVKAIYEALHK